MNSNALEHTRPRLSRRGFLQTSAFAGGGLLLGVDLPACRRRAGRGHAAHAQCLGPHRRRQHHHPAVGALRNGPGRLHLDADADRGGTERRHPQDQGRDRAAQHQALRQRAARRPAAHGRIDLRARRLGKAAHRRRTGARDADHRRGRQVEGRPLQTYRRGRHGAPAPAARRRPTASSPQRHRNCRCRRRSRSRTRRTSRIIGKRTKRLDTPAKVNGTAEFGIDVKLPGMVYASLEQCPVIGGTVKSFDATQGQVDAGRDRRRADPRRRRHRRRHLVACEEGARRPDIVLGRRRRARRSTTRPMLAGIRAGASGDIVAAQGGRRRRRGDQDRDEGRQGRIHDAAALALAAGADELHRHVPRRQGRPHRPDAVAGRGARHGRQGRSTSSPRT